MLMVVMMNVDVSPACYYSLLLYYYIIRLLLFIHYDGYYSPDGFRLALVIEPGFDVPQNLYTGF